MTYNCDFCNKKANYVCSKCKTTFYCNDSCQKKGWRIGNHFLYCIQTKVDYPKIIVPYDRIKIGEFNKKVQIFGKDYDFKIIIFDYDINDYYKQINKNQNQNQKQPQNDDMFNHAIPDKFGFKDKNGPIYEIYIFYNKNKGTTDYLTKILNLKDEEEKSFGQQKKEMYKKIRDIHLIEIINLAKLYVDNNVKFDSIKEITETIKYGFNKKKYLIITNIITKMKINGEIFFYNY